jgi:hypothetical protein
VKRLRVGWNISGLGDFCQDCYDLMFERYLCSTRLPAGQDHPSRRQIAAAWENQSAMQLFPSSERRSF